MSRGARLFIVLAAVVGALFAAVLVLRPETQAFRIPSESMSPTLEVDDRIRVNKDAYGDAGPERGDIVVIRPPQGAVGDAVRQCGTDVRPGELCPKPVRDAADVFFVERIVALPGDGLEVADGRAVVNGRRLDEPYIRACPPDEEICTFRGEITIPDDHFFVMGDNRGASDDSRFWGPVPRDQVIGRVDDCLPLGLWCSERDDG